jgi:outer membrane lipoprotein-sorting protein
MMAALLLAGQISAGAVVARAKEVDLQIQDLTARAHMAITSEGKTKERLFELKLLRDGVDYRAVITLIEPPEMAGTRFLIDARRGKRNRQWAYFPDLDLVREIAGRNQEDPFLGSDITYADLAGGAHIDDLVHRIVGEEVVDGAPCYLMEGIPRHDAGYGKLRGWVRKDSFVTVRAVFFDEDNEPLKEASLGDIRELDGVPLAHRIDMRSLIEDSRTLLTFEDVRINQSLDRELFTESALGTR